MFVFSRVKKSRFNIRFYSSNELKNIEIEVKFAYNNETEEKIRKMAKFVKKAEFEDIYWDFPTSNKYLLTTNDIWLRQRSSSWEIKIPFRFQDGISLNDKSPQIMDQYLELV
jgi:hypothetical protein